MKLPMYFFRCLVFLLAGPTVLLAQEGFVQSFGSHINALGNTQLVVAGDWTNSGMFSPATGTVVFNGNADQNLTALFEDNFFNLIVDKTAGVLFLDDNIFIDNTLNLTQGSVDMDTRNINLSPTAQLMENEGAGNIVFCTAPASGFIQTTRDLNMPNDLSIGGIGIGIISSSDLGSTYVGRSHTTVDVGLFSSIKRLSGVIPTNNSGLDATFIYNYFDSELNGQTEADLKLFVSYDLGVNWTLVNGTLDILSNRITLTNQDALGFYTASAGCLETVIQTEAMCKQSIEVALDASGTYTLVPDDLDDGSTGACGIASQTVIDGNLDCSDLGFQFIGMQVIGNDGVGSACISVVNVVDHIAPNAVCANPTISVGADGTVTLTPADLDGGTTDNCNVNLSLASTPTYNCNYIGFPQMETLIATDDSGNQSSCVATINIVDNVAPTALCKDYTASLSKSGRYKPKVQHINDGSFDNCGIASLSVDIPVFDCSSIGPGNYLTLTVTDDAGNQSTCVSEITIEDHVVPKIRCPLPITVDADPISCDAVVDYTVLYVDNCPGVMLNQLAGIASGGTFPIGMTTNTYEIVDVAGLSKTCSFVVTVNDPGGCVPAAPQAAENAGTGQSQPEDHQLFAFPNPSANTVQIRWQQARDGETQLEVRNLDGQRLAVLAQGLYTTGTNTVQWNSKEQQLSAGVYLLVLSTPDGQQSVLRLVLTP